MPSRVYLDANVLIAAFRGTNDLSDRAIEIIDDPDNSFVISDYLKLELLPKPTFNNYVEEVEFMTQFFDAASELIPSDENVVSASIDFASRYDLTPIDALHVVSAFMANVDELVTMEKPEKPMHRVTEIKLHSLYSK